MGVSGAVSKRSRYEQSNMRGGLGVRKRLSEESMRPTYRLNGVRTGFAVARCYDRFARWEGGYTVGIIVRKTVSVVQIRWADEPESIKSYDQGAARYEVDRGRWRILGPIQNSPLAENDPLRLALTTLRESARMGASANAGAPTTEEQETEEQDDEMARELSQAAAERAQARAALRNGTLQERETYTAKQIAVRCGTDPKTMRKFFRSSHSTVEPVGQGGRYEFDAKDMPKIKKEFVTWRKKAKARSTHNSRPVVPGDTEEVEELKRQARSMGDDEFTGDQLADAVQAQHDQEVAAFEKLKEDGLVFGEEPTEEDLAELEDLDLDDLDAEE